MLVGTYQVTADDVTAGEIVNTGSADSEETDEVTDDETVTVEGPGGAELAIVKTFNPESVSQGSEQTFTIEVSNDGSADASDVSITDNVNPYLDVTDVSLTSGTGDCSASSGQNVDCTVDVPAGESVTVTVAYVAPSFLPLPEGPLFGASGGSEFRFVFMNGYVLEGAAEAAVTLYNESGAAVATYTGDKKNDFFFDPPEVDGIDNPGFTMHLSCSDQYPGGYGSSGGPVAGVDDQWQVSSFWINRYKKGKPFKDCGGGVVPFEIVNTATATSGDQTVSDTATVAIKPS